MAAESPFMASDSARKAKYICVKEKLMNEIKAIPKSRSLVERRYRVGRGQVVLFGQGLGSGSSCTKVTMRTVSLGTGPVGPIPIVTAPTPTSHFNFCHGCIVVVMMMMMMMMMISPAIIAVIRITITTTPGTGRCVRGCPGTFAGRRGLNGIHLKGHDLIVRSIRRIDAKI
eukprot:scaffold4510_cov183-Amphora_coffeaeformis.AAC.109